VSLPLVWAGENPFFLYFYQRFFMMLLQPLAASHGSFCYLACVVGALLLWCLAAARVHAAVRRALLAPTATGAARRAS